MTKPHGVRDPRTDDQLREVRRLLRLHLNSREISQQMKLPLRTINRRVHTIRQEDEDEMRRLRSFGFSHDIRLAIESVEEQIRNLIVIRERSKSDFAKIEATRLIVECENWILDVKGYVPRLFEEAELQRRVGKLDVLSRQGTSEQQSVVSGDVDSSGAGREGGDPDATDATDATGSDDDAATSSEDIS